MDEPSFAGCVGAGSFFHPPSSHAAAATSGMEGRVARARVLPRLSGCTVPGIREETPWDVAVLFRS